MLPTIKQKTGSKSDSIDVINTTRFDVARGSSRTRAAIDSASESSPTGIVHAIAQLLSSFELREQFELSPEKVAQQLSVPASDWQAFIELDAGQLERQANTLLNKRWHEVRRLVPLTIELLRDEAVEVFRYYATNDWPIGHRRHPVDAFRFLQFLIANELQEPNQAELKKMRRLSSAQ